MVTNDPHQGSTWFENSHDMVWVKSQVQNLVNHVTFHYHPWYTWLKRYKKVHLGLPLRIEEMLDEFMNVGFLTTDFCVQMFL